MTDERVSTQEAYETMSPDEAKSVMVLEVMQTMIDSLAGGFDILPDTEGKEQLREAVEGVKTIIPRWLLSLEPEPDES
jgi:hypothetical protein